MNINAAYAIVDMLREDRFDATTNDERRGRMGSHLSASRLVVVIATVAIVMIVIGAGPTASDIQIAGRCCRG